MEQNTEELGTEHKTVLNRTQDSMDQNTVQYRPERRTIWSRAWNLIKYNIRVQMLIKNNMEQNTEQFQSRAKNSKKQNI